jgi:PIN like domain
MMLGIDDVKYVVDENLLSLGNGMVAVRRDTARFSRPPLEELLPRGINDPDWIPIVGNRGWVIVTSDKRLRTRPLEAELATTHKLKVVHLHGDIGTRSAWDQMVRIATRWSTIQSHVDRTPDGPWWLSVRRTAVVVMQFAPGSVNNS